MSPTLSQNSGNKIQEFLTVKTFDILFSLATFTLVFITYSHKQLTALNLGRFNKSNTTMPSPWSEIPALPRFTKFNGTISGRVPILETRILGFHIF